MVLEGLEPAPSSDVRALLAEQRNRIESLCLLSLFHGLYSPQCLDMLDVPSSSLTLPPLCVDDVYVTGSMGSGTMYSSGVLGGVWQNHSRVEEGILVSWFSR